MIAKNLATPALLAFVLGGCSTLSDLPTDRVGQASLTLANGVPAGTAQLLSNGTTVSIAIAVTGIEPGPHGFHLHTTGKCEAPGFTSAGGHLNPAGRQHGSENPSGKHLGDLPNLVVGANGTATAEFDLLGTRDQVLADIFDADGTAVMIHAGPDDYRSDPAGDAGSRIACGVLRPA
ncbi:superoxide dismutase family protein [Qipengyuania gaetbuli]|uniref:superoxide dismutase family protein n=1 Tax=Qipengyuania gaetbuli TaxID=266952 RepID=UPI001C99EC4C|nr:superoxide dismutase family protein [Qipengyuania gaetbuli]MBY6015438.1 superoxide dismutase family protein [Qipengyuania gaetbuli]